MITAVLALILVWNSLFLGKLALSALKLQAEPDENFLFSSALGMGVLSYGVIFLGSFGLLTPSLCWTMILATLAASFLFLKHLLPLYRDAAKTTFPGLTLRGLVFFALFLIVLICLIAGLKAPETANDSLCYHLYLPKVFLERHSIAKIPYEINSLFPFFMEMLYTLGLGLGSVTLAKFFHFYSGVLGVIAIVTISRKQSSLAAAWVAGLLFLTTPGIANQVSSTYVDVSFTTYSFLAVMAFMRWKESHQTPWLVLSGLLIGLTLGIKYLGAITLFALLILMTAQALSQKKSPVRWLALFSLAALMSGGFWYVRSWIEWGNPVYPYFAKLFGAGDPTIAYNDVGVPKTIFHFLKIFWTLTMSPQIFEGFGNNIGPSCLALAPGILFFRKSFSHIKSWSFYLLFYLFCWFILGQSLRFLFPILPVLSIFVAVSIHELTLRIPKWASFLIVSLLLSIHTGLAVYHFRSDFKYALGLQSADAYLLEHERSYQMAKFINSSLPVNAKILNTEEVHQFYINRDLVREALYSRDTSYENQVHNASELVSRLKRDGFTHILAATSSRQNPTYSAFRVPEMLKDPHNLLALSARSLYTCEFKEKDGTLFQYTLYSI